MHIESLDSIPRPLLEAMEQLRPLLLRETHTHDIRYHPEVAPVLDMLDEHLASRAVTAFHCTREAEYGYFVAKGLRKLDIRDHQAWFIDRFGSIFSPEQLSHIRHAWHNYFNSNQTLYREKMLWFCLMPELVADGCENFFRYFGGEAIYMAITEASVKKKLENIGRPVVVEILIPGADITTHQRLAIGTLNAFHRRINTAASYCGVEGYLSRNVAPSEVTKVWEKEAFFAHHCLSSAS